MAITFDTYLDIMAFPVNKSQLSEKQEERFNRIASQVHDLLCGIFGNEVIPLDHNWCVRYGLNTGDELSIRWCDQFFSVRLIHDSVIGDWERFYQSPNDDMINKLEMLCMLKRSDEVVMQGFSKGVNGKKLVLQETSRTWLMKLLEESLFGKSGTEERSLSELFWQDDPQKMLDSCKCNNKPVACDFPHLLGKLMNAWDFDLTDCPVKRNGSRKAFCESEYERFVFCYDLAEAYELLPIDTSLNKKEKYDKVKSMMATFSRKQRK